MILIIANYRTGSTTFAKELGGTGAEYLHDHIYKPPNSIWEDGEKFLPLQHVYKIMPDQFEYEKNYESFKKDYIEKAKKIYYTLREDINAQLESAMYASVTADYHPHGVGWNELASEEEQRKAKAFWHEGSGNIKTLFKNLDWQRNIYKEFGGELVWLENRHHNPRSMGKYRRRTDYTPDKFNYEINVREMFYE